MSTRTFDKDYEDWKPGDFIAWEDDKDGHLMQIVEIDEYGRIWWLENGTREFTRAIVNLVRVKEQAK